AGVTNREAELRARGHVFGSGRIRGTGLQVPQGDRSRAARDAVTKSDGERTRSNARLEIDGSADETQERAQGNLGQLDLSRPAGGPEYELPAGREMAPGIDRRGEGGRNRHQGGAERAESRLVDDESGRSLAGHGVGVMQRHLLENGVVDRHRPAGDVARRRHRVGTEDAWDLDGGPVSTDRDLRPGHADLLQ